MAGWVVGVGACLVTCAMAWRILQQSQEVSHALLAKLEGLSFPTVPATVPSGNWASVTIRLVRGSRAGPPVVGHAVKIMGKPFNDSDREEFESTLLIMQSIIRSKGAYYDPGTYPYFFTSTTFSYPNRITDWTVFGTANDTEHK